MLLACESYFKFVRILRKLLQLKKDVRLRQIDLGYLIQLSKLINQVKLHANHGGTNKSPIKLNYANHGGTNKSPIKLNAVKIKLTR